MLVTLTDYFQNGLGSAVNSLTKSAASDPANDIVAALNTKLEGLSAMQKTNPTSVR